MIRRILEVMKFVTLRVLLIALVVELLIHAGLWSIGHDSCLEPDSQTGWRVRSNIQKAFNGEAGPYLVETNSRGMRDVEHAYEHNEDVFRIVALGACGTFGLGVAERDCYVSRIEDFVPNSETVNLGAIGFSADQEFILLEKEGLRYQPDLVVQFLIKADGRAVFYPWTPLMGSKPHLTYEDHAVTMQSATSHFWPKVLNLSHIPWAVSSIDGWHEVFFPHAIPGNEDRFRGVAQLLLETQTLCHNAGAEYLAVFVPEPSNVHTYSIFGDDSYTLTPRVLDYLEEQQVMHTLNLMEPMLVATQDQDQLPPFSKIDQSLSPAGHEIVARCVAEKIKSSQALKVSHLKVARQRDASYGS